jgi:hypothetical protein
MSDDPEALAVRQERWREAAEPALRAWIASAPEAAVLDPGDRETAVALLVTLEVMERTAHTLRAEQDPEWLKASEAALRLWNHLARLGYPRVSRLAAELDAAHT